mmetsp:Transcript_5259/g.5380  ORF Transcript_5259/g.5380 Transcript_5259/m.5380 type:complete len:124 (+) Transcript_5259:78-449(+)
MSFAGGDRDEFATSLAVLALYDGGAEITSDQISTLLTATNNHVQPYWPTLFASNLGSNVGEIIFNRGGGVAPVASAAGSAPAAAGGDSKSDKKEDAPKKVEEVVDALEGGMDMFGGGGGGGDY